jgi:type I restriction enzyme S subunit
LCAYREWQLLVHAAQIIVPSDILISLFDEQAEIIFRQTRLLEQQNKRLSEARDLLLPRLMNGEIAV